MSVKATRQVLISGLKPYPGNARVHDVAAIRQSLRANGQYRAVVVRAPEMTILAGHGTVAAACEEGWQKVLVHLVEVDDEQARRIVLADNRTAELGGYDDSLLLALLEASPVLEGTGWDDATLKALRATLDQDRRGEDTEPPPLPDAPKSRPGQLYKLGRHRLLCGDATSAGDVERLFAGEHADLVVTDPPYGIAYQRMLGSHPDNASPAERKVYRQKQAAQAKALHRRSDGLLELPNDALGAEGTQRLVADAMGLAPLKKGGGFYVCTPPGDMDIEFRLALIAAGLPARHSLVWVKDALVMGRADYHYRHELILYGWRAGAAHYFIDDRKQDTVWEVPRPRASKVHPTMKPLELFERMVANSSRPEAIVYDPFAGSGTTLIACENLGRRALVCDVDPGYCDVIRARYEQHVA